MKFRYTRSSGVQLEDHDINDVMDEMFGRTGRRRDHSAPPPPGKRIRLMERMRRLRGVVAETEDVWDFGRPSAPRSCRDYERELGLGTSPWHAKTSMVAHQAPGRAYYEQNHGRSIVSAELVNALMQMLSGRVVEPFAGMGWLAAHLRCRGLDMLALDNFSQPAERIWTTVEDQDVAVACSDADWVIMSWPPHTVVAQRVVMRMKRGAGLILLCDSGRDADYRRMPTPGFWHHLSRSETDRAAGQLLQAAQPIWAGVQATWQVIIKH